MKPDIKDRDFMYKLIIGQLFYDGHQQMALNLAQSLGLSLRPPPPSDKLFRLVTVAKQYVEDPEAKEREAIAHQFGVESAGLDLEFDADVVPNSPEPSLYETVYLTTHKGPCRTAAFSSDGSLAATASVDCSIKIMEVDKIISIIDTSLNESGPDSHRPVIRTLYDHMDLRNHHLAITF